MTNINKLKESQFLELMKGKGGLPKSILETYSAFANTNGGQIIIGIEESENGNTLVGLTEKEVDKLIKDFMDVLNSNQVSVNLLEDKSFIKDKVDDKFYLIINVPRANNDQKPVYIHNDIYQTYKRLHEGDYKCTFFEIQAMLRDKNSLELDGLIIDKFDLKNIKTESLESYINRFKVSKGTNHPFIKDNDIDSFLYRIGAADYNKDNVLKPTAAGLLMFGNEYDITKIYSHYILDYLDLRNLSGQMRYSNRIVSFSGEWSGNVYDFYFRIVNKLMEDIKQPFILDGIYRVEENNLHKVVREGLVNALSNCDYYGGTGVVVKQYLDKIEFNNAGLMLVPLEQAIVGGLSKPRNSRILKMFSLIDIGERVGSGIPFIFNTADELNLYTPNIEELKELLITKLTVYLSLDKENHSQLENDGNQKPENGNQKPENGNQKPENGITNIVNRIEELNASNKVKTKMIRCLEIFKDNSFTLNELLETGVWNKSQMYFQVKLMLENKIIIKNNEKYKFNI